jgi:hypothetical protein
MKLLDNSPNGPMYFEGFVKWSEIPTSLYLVGHIWLRRYNFILLLIQTCAQFQITRQLHCVANSIYYGVSNIRFYVITSVVKRTGREMTPTAADLSDKLRLLCWSLVTSHTFRTKGKWGDICTFVGHSDAHTFLLCFHFETTNRKSATHEYDPKYSLCTSWQLDG